MRLNNGCFIALSALLFVLGLQGCSGPLRDGSDCIPHHHKGCFNGHVNWFDSCDLPEERAELCLGIGEVCVEDDGETTGRCDPGIIDACCVGGAEGEGEGPAEGEGEGPAEGEGEGPAEGEGEGEGPVCTDRDGDGYGQGCARGSDCDDNDRSIHPDADERCNGIDDNCDGVRCLEDPRPTGCRPHRLPATLPVSADSPVTSTG